MPRWEYLVVEEAADAVKKMTQRLNQAGLEGWEAVASWGIKKGIGRDAAAVILKRPIDG